MTLRTPTECENVYESFKTFGNVAQFEPITPLVIDVEPSVKDTDIKKPRGKTGEEPEPGRNKRASLNAVSDMLFSTAIIMILFMVLLSGADGGTPKNIFDFYCFTVLSPSMQDEIPQGSFILVKKTDPFDLKTGDNITFMADKSTSVTHKIAGIYENYAGSGARGFLTKGVNNLKADQDVVFAVNVVGKVVFVLPAAGAALSYLNDNVFLVFIIFGLVMILSFLLRGIFVRPAEKLANN